MIEDASDNGAVAILGDALKPMVEIVVIVIEPDREALEDRGWQVCGRTPPLFLRVELEKGLVELIAYKFQRLFLKRLWIRYIGA